MAFNLNATRGAVALRSPISAVARNADQLDVFVTGTDYDIYSIAWNANAGWGRWFPLPGVSAFFNPPAVVARNPDHLDLFVTGNDGQVFSTWWDASSGWGTWFALAGLIPGVGSPITALARYPDHLDLFVPGPGSAVYSTSWDASSGWGTWFPVPGLTAGWGGPIAAVARKPDHLDLFVTGADRRVYSTWWDADGGWGTPFPLPGVTAGHVSAQTGGYTAQPAAVARNVDHLDLFITGDDGRVYSTWWDANAGWGTWFPLPGVTTAIGSPITAVARDPDHLDLFVTGNDGRIFSTWWDASSGWGNWFIVSGVTAALASPITTIARNPDHLDLFVTGDDGRIYSTSWDAREGWGRWFPVGSPISHVFVLMLENRSFDHMLGFSGITGTDTATGQPTSIDGLNGTESNSVSLRTVTRMFPWPITAIAPGSDNLRVFAVGTLEWDNGIYSARWDATGDWGDWSLLRGVRGAYHAVVARTADHLDLFVTGNDGQVYSTWWDVTSGWGNWFPVPGLTPGFISQITAVASGPDRVDLFVEGKDGRVQSTWWDARSGWGTPFAVPGLMNWGEIAAVARKPHHLDLFSTKFDDQHRVYSTWWDADGGWGTPFALPGVTAWHMTGHSTAQPVAVARDSDHLDLFIRGDDGRVYSTWWDASGGWGTWFPLPGVTTAIESRITVVSRDPDHLDLFVTGSDGLSYSLAWGAIQGWGEWFALPNIDAGFASPFAAVARDSAHLDLFATGADAVLYALSWNAETGWGDWRSLGDLNLTYSVSKGAADVMRWDPSHNFGGTLVQLCGPGIEYPPGGAYPINDPRAKPNSGFVYAMSWKPGVDAESVGDAMKCFSPTDLPVLNALAKEFVVCDRWFSSMPGPTWPNRFFMHLETSGVFDDNLSHNEVFVGDFGAGGIRFRNPSVFDLLTETGVKHRVYADDDFPMALPVSRGLDIRGFDDLAKDLRDQAFDAGFVHIEPSYDALNDFAGGNSQHPTGSVAAGERFIKATYEAIRSSPVWEKSLLIIVWDEHGGFYDHVTPPSAKGTGEVGRTHGFTFEQLGPRVPAVVVSPLISRNLIEHRTFDHTAIPATLRGVFGIRSVGGRNGITGGVDDLVTPSLRTDAPMTLPDAAASARLTLPARRRTAVRRPSALLSDDPDGTLAVALQCAVAQHLRVVPAAQHAAIRARVHSLRTRADLATYLHDVERLMRTKRVELAEWMQYLSAVQSGSVPLVDVVGRLQAIAGDEAIRAELAALISRYIPVPNSTEK